MRHSRPQALVIALDPAWTARQQRLLLRFDHLRPQDVHLVRGGENDLIARLQTLLYMARQTVIDLLRSV